MQRQKNWTIVFLLLVPMLLWGTTSVAQESSSLSGAEPSTESETSTSTESPTSSVSSNSESKSEEGSDKQPVGPNGQRRMLANYTIGSVSPHFVEPGAPDKTQMLTPPPHEPKSFTDPITGMEFVLVKGGCYPQGDTFREGKADSQQVHWVCVDNFYLGKYEVSRKQFYNFAIATGYTTEPEETGGCWAWTKEDWLQNPDADWENPAMLNGYTQGDDDPVVCVSWNDTQAYLTWMNKNYKNWKKRKNIANYYEYRLPTESEWEYACKEGKHAFRYGTGSNRTSADVANYDAREEYLFPGASTGPYREHTIAGDALPANNWGLHHMTGNAWEWVEDWYSPNFYENSPNVNPANLNNERMSQRRVSRGGAWNSVPRWTRCANRFKLYPGLGSNDHSFRVVLRKTYFKKPGSWD